VNLAYSIDPLQDHQPRKILVVEDDFVNVFIMKQMLDNQYDTRYAKSGQEVMELIKSHDFDLILMDIHLTDDSPSGVEIMKTLRGIPRYSKTGIFAITSYHQIHDKERFLSEGFDDFFTKPVSKEELIEAMEKSLKNHAE
jgi:CheY-like chemotaxis protein